MNILDLVEQEDGSAIVTFDLTAEEVFLFAKEGILSALTRSAERIIKDHNIVENGTGVQNEQT